MGETYAPPDYSNCINTAIQALATQAITSPAAAANVLNSLQTNTGTATTLGVKDVANIVGALNTISSLFTTNSPPSQATVDAFAGVVGNVRSFTLFLFTSGHLLDLNEINLDS